MGTFTETVYISDGNGGPVVSVDVLVDTGATFTVLPASLLRDRLGIGHRREDTFILADGGKKTLPIGDAHIAVAGREAPSPVVFGAEDRFLMGATSLQSLGLVADTTNHRLIPAPELYL